MTEIDLEAIARRALETFPPDNGDRELARDFARRLLFKEHARSIGPSEIEPVGAALDRAVDALDMAPPPPPVAAAGEVPAPAPESLSDAEIEDCIARSFDAVFDGSPERADLIAERARAALDRLVAARGLPAAEIRARAEPVIERYRREIVGPPGPAAG